MVRRWLASGIAVAWTVSAVASPVQLVHSGRLLDALGVPVNGALDLDVSLHDASTGGNQVFTQHFEDVAVADGYFSVVLGSTGTLQHTAFTGAPLWVQDQVGATVLPRQPVGVAPVAAFTHGNATTNVDPVFGGLISYWRLDETSGSAVDDAHAGNDGVASGTTVTVGVRGNARLFDGSNDYVSFGDINDLDGLNAFSVSIWVKPDGFLVDHNGLFVKHAGASNQIMLSTYAGSPGMVYAYVNNGATTGPNSSAGLLVPGVWNHLVLVYNGAETVTQRVRLYRNGTLASISGGTPPTTGPSNGGNVVLGCYPESGGCPSSGDHFYGALDEVGVWARALTAAEVTTLYASGAGYAY